MLYIPFNLMILLTAVYFYASAYAGVYSQKEQEFDLSMARIAVREEINTIPYLKDKSINVKKSCSQLDSNGGTIVGQALSSDTFRMIEGVPMSEKTEFSYEAKVQSHCSRFNLNCYAVQRLELQGMKAFYPQL